MKELITVEKLNDYEPQNVHAALSSLLEPFDGLSFIKPGMKVAVKMNLVTGASPEKAVTTHPEVLKALSVMIRERGGIPVIGDSPGGPFNEGALKHSYRLSGLTGGELTLNYDTGIKKASFPDARVLKSISYTSWLTECDAIIGVCKLKTHGMMKMSANVKNFFGAIPGTEKIEYHYRFPDHQAFADMLIDINEFLKPSLYITDAVIGMEGNGPTFGTPREIGVLLASKDPYGLDAACATVMGIDPLSVPTVKAAFERNLWSPDSENDFSSYTVPDFELNDRVKEIDFHGRFMPKFMVPVAKKILQSRPGCETKICIGCGKCADVCPAKAILIKDKKPFIDRNVCIRCFCCQEFCPVGAMRVKRPFVAKTLARL